MTQLLEMARNGVDTQQMYGTLDAITAQPELGVFQFRATNHWLDGSHNRTTIQHFYGAGQEDTTRERDLHDRRRRAGDPAAATTAARTRPSTCSTRWQPA